MLPASSIIRNFLIQESVLINIIKQKFAHRNKQRKEAIQTNRGWERREER